MAIPMAEPRFFEVRDVARACDVADATVRAWERAGLIDPPARTPAGRRIFTRDDLERIRARRTTPRRREVAAS